MLSNFKMASKVVSAVTHPIIFNFNILKSYRLSKNRISPPHPLSTF